MEVRVSIFSRLFGPQVAAATTSARLHGPLRNATGSNGFWSGQRRGALGISRNQEHRAMPSKSPWSEDLVRTVSCLPSACKKLVIRGFLKKRVLKKKRVFKNPLVVRGCWQLHEAATVDLLACLPLIAKCASIVSLGCFPETPISLDSRIYITSD